MSGTSRGPGPRAMVIVFDAIDDSQGMRLNLNPDAPIDENVSILAQAPIKGKFGYNVMALWNHVETPEEQAYRVAKREALMVHSWEAAKLLEEES